MTEERKLSSRNLALVLVHDILLSNGIQAGDGPLKQAILRHKTRLHSEFQRIKIKRGVRLNHELAQAGDARASTYHCFPTKIKLETNLRPQHTFLVMFVSIPRFGQQKRPYSPTSRGDL